MQTLSRDLRRVLENTVRNARQVAEVGARAALQQLTVAEKDAGGHLSTAQKALRNRLRAHARQLGDPRDQQKGTQAIGRLVVECAYEHWHRLLFARFLAETELLIEPESGQAISLDDCRELARSENADWLELAAEYAQRMLPQIFRAGDPVLEIALPPETRSALEDLMKGLPNDVFTAEDSLGWVYQYWQADRKEEVNRSEKKIGPDELPAVTQLFTEDYMVLFLLHNTLGAWWAGRVLAKNPPLAKSAASEDELRAACAVGDIQWTYLRFVRDGKGLWRPAAGTFDGWPKAARDITFLDPCMGSGHFLVFALPILAAMRGTEESLAPDAAIEGALRDNLFGLEIDPRCTQIAAFNLAFAAWRRIGYRSLPPLHLACSGLSLGVTKAEWLRLAERAAQALPLPPKSDLLGTEHNLFSDAMKRGFERLYDLFARAPWLGSLIDARAHGGDLVEQGFDDLQAVLTHVTAKADSADVTELAVAAQGFAKAADILAKEFTLVITNVPYLGRGKQDEVLKEYCEKVYPEAKADLSTCFVLRCIRFTAKSGCSAQVTPQNWCFQASYTSFRKTLLSKHSWNFLVLLGSNAFQDMNWWAAVTALSIISNEPPLEAQYFAGLDVGDDKNQDRKAQNLAERRCAAVVQREQLQRANHIVSLTAGTAERLLADYAKATEGLSTGDGDRFLRNFWEVDCTDESWSVFQGTSLQTSMIGGLSEVVFWEGGQGDLAKSDAARIQGHAAWNQRGVLVSRMNRLTANLYFGSLYDKMAVTLVPLDIEDLPAVWAFCSDEAYHSEVRTLSQNAAVATATLAQVPFSRDHWRAVAAEKFPSGLPAPHSAEPTQWIFGGHPMGASNPLQAGIARIVGYQWPRQRGSSFLDCPALSADGLERHADRDGIVTLSPAKGEQPAESRLVGLLADAYGAEWSAARLAQLLTEVGFARKTLDDWLRDAFFEQHCELFHQRPFVWHVWDGRRDGFNALVNYHRLAAPNGEGRRTLEKLLYTYLGDWIDRQRADQRAGVEGADARVAAAEQLKTELQKVLAGEPPYDIFARWKPVAEQPIGWEPNINDGVRTNIRPFMMAKPMNARARGACILRVTPKIKWDKDRGKEPKRSKAEYPWFWGWDEETQDFTGGQTFDGVRWNDLHYSVAAKNRARGR
jgi:hypothetical protein